MENRRCRPLSCTSVVHLILLGLLLPFALRASAADINIGVLALRGPDKARAMWSATAEYLDRALPGDTFHIVPLGFEEVRLAVRRGSVDFVLTNSAYYVELETLYGVSAVATLRNRFDDTGYSVFGGVIFTRADRNDIRRIQDLRQKTFAAVNASSFGGWQVAWLEMKHQGLNPEKDCKLSFEATHDQVVYAVRDGKAAAGTVRTDTLERMAAEGKIRLSDFYVLNQQHVEGFPMLLSTPLYPEWPMAKLQKVPDDLAIKVAVALMQMPPEAPAARAAMIKGWTLPHNYQSVREAMRELRTGPYESLRRPVLQEVLAEYGRWLILALAVVVAALSTLAYVGQINRRLRQKQQALRELNATLEERVQGRTGEVLHLLDREHFLRGIVEMVADVNQILITANSKEEMLKACCDRLVAHEDYRFSWVGLLQDGELNVAARSYGSAEFMRNLLKNDAQAASRDALRENRTVLESDGAIAADLREAGVKALIVLPLRRDAYAEALGTLCVLTGREEGFDREEVAMLEQLAGDIGFAVHSFSQRLQTRQLEQDRISNYEETILSLVDMIEKRDTYTAGHTRRVAQYCELIAARLDLPAEEIEKLKRAAILHDIGKIVIPDAVLLKPGQLTPLEYDLIKQHADVGYRTLIRIDMYKELAEIMRYHHEREDGSGYPQGLKDGQIPRLSQIMAVADAFDAMTTNRIYKPRKTVVVALEELRGLAGDHYDADIVAAACEALRDVEPPPVADQLPKTLLERQRFAYFFDDQLTGVHNASYLQFMLRNGLPSSYRLGYIVYLHHFSAVNAAKGWAAGNQVLAHFAGQLLVAYPDTLVFRIMGDDFILLSTRSQEIDAAGLEALPALADSGVAIEVGMVELDAAGLARLQELV